MNRYLSSFIIAFILYTSALVAVFYFINKNQSCHARCGCETMHKINIAMISPLQTSVTQPKQEKKVEPKPKPKPKPKPIEKPKPKQVQKPKPLLKPLEKPKTVVQQEVVKTIPLKKEQTKAVAQEEVQEKLQKEVAEEFFEVEKESEDLQDETHEVTQESATAKAQQEQILQAKKNLFLTNLMQRINDNKSYPNMARRRCMEGDVEVQFVIMSDGTVEDIKVLSGRRIFKKSTIQAISRCFPMEVDTTLFNFPKEFKIKISYVLR